MSSGPTKAWLFFVFSSPLKSLLLNGSVGLSEDVSRNTTTVLQFYRISQFFSFLRYFCSGIQVKLRKGNICFLDATSSLIPPSAVAMIPRYWKESTISTIPIIHLKCLVVSGIQPYFYGIMYVCRLNQQAQPLFAENSVWHEYRYTSEQAGIYRLGLLTALPAPTVSLFFCYCDFLHGRNCWKSKTL